MPRWYCIGHIDVSIELPDFGTARASYESEEYRHAAELRNAAGNADVVIVENYEGP